MNKLRNEDLSQFESPWLHIESLGPLSTMPIRRCVRRDEKLQLIFETVHEGWGADRDIPGKEGEFLKDDAQIVFGSQFGTKAVAKHVIPKGWSSHDRSGRLETTQICTMHSIEIRYLSSLPERYSVEWLCNLPTNLIWSDMVESVETTEATRELVGKAGTLVMRHSTETRGSGRSSLRFAVMEREFFLVSNKLDGDVERNVGFLVCDGIPARDQVERVLDALSFVIGRPIISMGHTHYDENWSSVFSRSVSPHSNDGRYFALHTLPPFPIVRQGSRNLLDREAVNATVGQLLTTYDDLGFQYLSWAYWHAMCAPYHMEAAHFGALIENVQNKIAKKTLGSEGRSIMSRAAWRILRDRIITVIGAESLAPDVLALISKQVSDANRLPQKKILMLLCDAIGAPIEDLELSAWSERNNAAHGNTPTDHIDTILNAKVLRLILHRIIAGYTKCAISYNDYYSVGFPVRSIEEPLPRRDDHLAKPT